MKHVVVFIDVTGTPSVKGPFATLNLATQYASHMQKEHYFGDEKTRIKIAGLTSVSEFCDGSCLYSTNQKEE